jgi:hypothetical protein
MDVSEGVVDVSAGLVDVSEGVVDVSEGVVDVSGISMDVSGVSMDVSGVSMGMSGIYMDVSGSSAPPRVTMADILASQEVLLQTENMDRVILNSIGQMSADALRTILISWATAGFPNAYPIQDITITPPPRCSDGVTRNLADYITFCSGKSIQEHVAVLQDMLPDIAVAFCYTGASIQIVVSRPTV